MSFNFYKYIDDTDHAWLIKVSDHLAAAAGLEFAPDRNPAKTSPIGPNYKPRHIRLVALSDRPGKQKYRVSLITNERDPSVLLNKIITIQGIEMRCVAYIGEQRTGY